MPAVLEALAEDIRQMVAEGVDTGPEEVEAARSTSHPGTLTTMAAEAAVADYHLQTSPAVGLDLKEEMVPRGLSGFSG